MKLTNNVVALFTLIWFCSYVIANNGLIHIPSDPYDLNAPCQPYIEKFAEASSKMIKCATVYSSPPKVCTYCTEEYIALKHIEYKLLNLENVFSHDNISCSRVIYQNYLISYVSEVSSAITRNIWENSRCSSCVNISWNFETNSTEYAYYNDTINFQNKLYDWRHCVSSFFSETNQSIICDKCLSSFNELFQFYWHIYVTPNINFCLDVETTMNDTMNLWHNVWHCPDDRVEELRDWTLLGYSLVLLMIITAFFYAGSYIQSSEIQRHLVQYSQLAMPSGIRSHLLSSSLDRVSSMSSTSGTEQITTLE
ncbi:Coelomocyte uptake defective protein [Dirofilaria immitis]